MSMETAAPADGPARVRASAIRAFIRDALVAVEIPPDDAVRLANELRLEPLRGRM